MDLVRVHSAPTWYISCHRGEELLGREETVGGLGLSVASVLQVELKSGWQIKAICTFKHMTAD